jgi:hypothetical protein
MFEYRVTKYDPAFRDTSGAYNRAEWTAVSDIGRSFNGEPLTEAEYLRVESAYIATALEFLRESGVSSLVVRGLENHREAALTFGNGAHLSLEQVGVSLSRVLREEFWCKLEGPDSFVHIGYDYYMYLGVPTACPKAEQLAASLGLFVESFQSPYGDLDAA